MAAGQGNGVGSAQLRKNVASQYVYFMVWITSAAPLVPRTGDAGNISMFVALNGANESAAANSPAEVDATNLPGVYRLQLSQAETNADSVIVGGTSITANTAVSAVQVHTTIDFVDGLTLASFRETILAVLAGVVAKTSTGASFKAQDGTTEKVEVVHDSEGNRTTITVQSI